MTTNTASAIIQKSHEDAGVCAVGQVVTSAQFARGLDRLNDIINFQATQGLKLWLQRDITVPLVAGKVTYRLGPAGDVVMARPLQILQGYYISPLGERQPLIPLSREEYTRLTQPVVSTIVSYFVDKQATFFDVSFWNSPDTFAATGTCHLIARVAAPNVVLSGDSAQFPVEWTIFLRWALAGELAIGQSQEIQSRCDQRAAAYRESLESFDVEDAPTFFQPNIQSYNRFR